MDDHKYEGGADDNAQAAESPTPDQQPAQDSPQKTESPEKTPGEPADQVLSGGLKPVPTLKPDDEPPQKSSLQADEPIIVKSNQLEGTGEVKVSEGERMEKNSSKNKIVPIVADDAPPAKETKAPDSDPKKSNVPESKDAYEKLELDEKVDEQEKPPGTCQKFSPYVLNHEFMDLQVHDKGSGNIKCMCNLQWCMRIIWFILLTFVIFYAFYYPIMMDTSAGTIKKIRTYTSQNPVNKKELSLQEFGIQNFVILKDKKKEVIKKVESVWLKKTFIEINGGSFDLDKDCKEPKLKEEYKTIMGCPSSSRRVLSSRRRKLLDFMGGLDKVQETSTENDKKTDPEVKKQAEEAPKKKVEASGGGVGVSIVGGAEEVINKPPPVVDIEKLEKEHKEKEAKKSINLPVGNLQDIENTAAENDKKTSPEVTQAAEAVKKEIAVVQKEFQYPELTDNILNGLLCHGIFMVIKEEIKSSESIVFTPDCQIIEASDGTLIIHNDFQSAKSRVVKSQMNLWDHKKVSKGNELGQSTFIFENNENKMHSLVIINDPKQSLYNEETKTGIQISRQYIVSSNKKPPSKDKIANEYISYIENSELLVKILISQEIGKQVPMEEQIDLHFFSNLTKGKGAEQGVYAHNVGMRLHLAKLATVEAMKTKQTELPLTFDFRERIQEIQYHTFEDYIMDVGSFLQLFTFVLYVCFSPIGFLFVYTFITSIIKLIMKKYREAAQLNQIEKHLKKFRLINEALAEKKNEPEFKDIYDDVQYYIDLDLSTQTFDQIEELHHKMKKLDKKLPDIADLESMISTVRFQQPLAQKIMDEQIEKVINDRADFSLSQVSELVRKRLSLVSIYQMYDDIQLELEKMNAELHIQSEKLQFLFNTIAERAERRKSRRSPSKV